MNRNILSQPYPKPFNNWVLTLAISGFIALFMLVFQPFGLAEIQGAPKVWILLGYGLVTAVALLFNLILLPQLLPTLFAESHWTVLREIVFILWILVCVSAGNFFYTLLFFQSIGGLTTFLGYTLSVGIIPVAVITLINQNSLLRTNDRKAGELNTLLARHTAPNKSEILDLCADNGQVKLRLAMNQLLFLESSGNYVSVYHRTEDGIQKDLLRNTLGDMEVQLRTYENIVRCHRAYLVNLEHVHAVSGNAQGLKLTINATNLSVPVSRKYVEMIRTRI